MRSQLDGDKHRTEAVLLSAKPAVDAAGHHHASDGDNRAGDDTGMPARQPRNDQGTNGQRPPLVAVGERDHNPLERTHLPCRLAWA